MTGAMPFLVVVCMLFFVALVAFIRSAGKQQAAKLQPLWACFAPLINGEIENQTLRGRWNDFPVEANIDVHISDDGEETHRFELSLRNCVGTSDWMMTFGSELLGQGEWKWRVKSRNAVLARALEQSGAIAVMEKMLPQVSSQNAEETFEEAQRILSDLQNARHAATLSSATNVTDSPWSSDGEVGRSGMVSGVAPPSISSVGEKMMPFLTNMGRWAMYPKIEFETRSGALFYRATVDAEKSVSPEHFQAQLELLVQLAQLNCVCNR